MNITTSKDKTMILPRQTLTIINQILDKTILPEKLPTRKTPCNKLFFGTTFLISYTIDEKNTGSGFVKAAASTAIIRKNYYYSLLITRITFTLRWLSVTLRIYIPAER